MSDALLQELLDREAIKALKARYFRLMDTKDWDGWRALFADDAHFELLHGDPIDDADEFVASVRGVLDGARTAHHGHMPEIEMESPTEARAVWALNDYVEWEPDPETGVRRGIEGFGHYHETYRKIDGAWRIASLRLSYLRIDPLPREALPDTILGGPDLREDAKLG
jgi:hypothetical protein